MAEWVHVFEKAVLDMKAEGQKSSSRAWTGIFVEKSNLTPEIVHGIAVNFSTASDEIININQHLAFRRVFV